MTTDSVELIREEARRPPAMAAGGTPAVTVDGVGVRLGGRIVLDGVSFAIAPGEFTGLIGANGAGKTTLLRVILGLLRPSAGQVQIGAGSRGARSVGYVPQKVVVDPDLPLRARDLVELGLDGWRWGIRLFRGAERRRAVSEMLEAVGAREFADARVGRLSGGELQRVLMAHALIGRPELLLLDEPLANLDLRSGHEVVALLHRISKEQGVAVLLSAHEVNPLLPVMDRVVYLADGRAVAGSTNDVIRSDVLSQLYGHHVDVLNVHGRVLVVVGDQPADGTPGHGPVLDVD